MIAYMVTNKVNGMKYIGITINDVRRRWRSHVQGGNGCGKYLASAIKKYGEDNFKIEQIASALGGVENLKNLEIDLIRQHETFAPKGYNLTLGGDGVFGYKHSQESINKRLESMKGYVVSEKTRQKMRESALGENNHFFGKHHSDESKKRISEAKKINQSKPWLGKKRSEETKEKISRSLLGRVGKKHTEESRLKLSLAHTGKKQNPPSDETRKKLSESMKLIWAKRKLEKERN